jgi:hypothetical protein
MKKTLIIMGKIYEGIVLKENVLGWDMPKFRFVSIIMLTIIIGYGYWFVLPLLLSTIFDFIIDREKSNNTIMKYIDIVSVAIIFALTIYAII